MSKVNKILEEIHPLHIIREVQKWPVLYVKDSPERANLHFKNKIWREVAKALFTDWDSFSNKEKDKKVLDLSKKWRNLRDTFKRQLATEKKMRENNQTERKKRYVYFKHMLYLLPHVKSGSETPDPVLEPKLNEYFNTQIEPKKGKDRKKSKVIPNPVEDIDEDKHFLMSLIPSFKKMNDNEKLTAKVEILKVIKDIRQKSESECIPAVDSLSYNVDDSDIGDIKVELFQETDRARNSDSSDSENSD